MSKEMKRYIVTYNPNGKIADVVQLKPSRAPAYAPPRWWTLLRLLFNRRAYSLLMYSAIYAIRYHDVVRGIGASDVLLFESQGFFYDWVAKTDTE